MYFLISFLNKTKGVNIKNGDCVGKIPGEIVHFSIFMCCIILLGLMEMTHFYEIKALL